jgi:hypothetical protein
MLFQLSLPKIGGGQVTFDDPVAAKFQTPGDILTEIFKYLFPLAGIILFFFLIAGGFLYLISAGNEEQTKKASTMLTNAIVGFVILFVSFWLMKLLQFVFGFEVL